MRRWIAAISLCTALAAGACAGPSGQSVAVESARTPSQLFFIEIEANPKRGYHIDRTSRSCTLIYELWSGAASAVAVPLDCATLAANSAEAARHVTWYAPGREAVPPPPPPAP